MHCGDEDGEESLSDDGSLDGLPQLGRAAALARKKSIRRETIRMPSLLRRNLEEAALELDALLAESQSSSALTEDSSGDRPIQLNRAAKTGPASN